MKVGAVLTVDGDWRVDKRYGRQFAAQSRSEELPATIVGIEKYLGSGLVKGIGPKFAKLIVSHFGLETFDVIEKDADRLLEVPGIGKTRVALIRECWEKQKDVKDTMVFLQGHGVSSNFHIKYLERPSRRTDWQQLKIHNKTVIAETLTGVARVYGMHFSKK